MWPAWLWIGTKLKMLLWLGNRVVTWTGLLYFWSRFRTRRLVWLWVGLINLGSLVLLGTVFFWLHLNGHR